MIRDIFYFFTGTKEIKTEIRNSTDIADFFLCEKMNIIKSCYTDDEKYSVILPSYSAKKAAKNLSERSIDFEISNIKGFPIVFKFLSCRPGLIAGLLFFSFFVTYMSNIVCSLDICSNTDVNSDEVLSILDEVGCGLGDYIPGIDFDDVHAKFLSKCNDIAWISVNMKGNRGIIELLPAKHGKTFERKDGVYANIVAGEDAQIVNIQTRTGQTVVGEGDIVKKGDLLVSGVVALRREGVRYDFADAEVMAEVNRKFVIEIPFENDKKEYTGRSETKKKLKILKKQINLFSKGGIEYSTYDKIEDSKRLMLFGKIELPVWIKKTIYNEYTHSSEKISLSKARDMAQSELRDLTDSVLEDSEILSKKTSIEVAPDKYVLTCEMVCLTDIAEVQIFEAD